MASVRFDKFWKYSNYSAARTRFKKYFLTQKSWGRLTNFEKSEDKKMNNHLLNLSITIYQFSTQICEESMNYSNNSRSASFATREIVTVKRIK